jgi:hypothetical protein
MSQSRNALQFVDAGTSHATCSAPKLAGKRLGLAGYAKNLKDWHQCRLNMTFGS